METTRQGRLILGPDRHGSRLVIDGDRVTAWGPPDDGEEPASGRIDCPEGEIRPGRINAHTHVYSGLAPLGMPPPSPPPQSFVQILERVWWRLDRALDEASLRASARYYVAEALRAGTTTLVDHHESPNFIEGSLDVLADVCQELGMRAVLCFGATERNGGRREARRGLDECRRFARANHRPLVRSVVGLHASFTVSDETIREGGELCRELGTVMHVHLAEDRADVRDAVERGFAGPLDRLLELGALPSGSILAHGVHCSADEVRRAAEHQLWFVQNPRSNRGNGVGYPGALGESDRVALGTDGYPARMEEEAAVLFELAAGHGEDRGVVEKRVAGGWRLAAERFGAPFSPLAAGALADAVVMEGGAVTDVVVGGRHVVAGGRLATADLEEIRAEARRQAPRLWARMEAL